ncbi:putative disease resistance protein RGA4 [Ziziphus jujuba]|uniref:Disease resistance protein RGA4 n=1 Tax=Ziziphus jujuba TaxID=326968 RepID=A0ABM3IKV0_ZIZJJ|nr:putative disease resistance protein RGA4 [Ziziphus jujuba]
MEDILPTLKLSYDHLPSHLKHCFAYCRLFPKDYVMDVQTLTNLWVAQDFIKASEPNQCLEEAGYDCFKELLWRYFFQVVKKDEWGNIATCKMHDLMHDLAIFVAGTKCATLNGNDRNINKKTRHVSFDCNSNSHMFGEMLPSLIEAKKIRSAIIVCNDNFTHRGVIIGTFRTAQYSLCDAIGSNLKLLRTLNLQNLNMREVPKSIGKLKHLRYLDLSENWFEALPNSITKLHNLQTLKLNSCKQLGMLPKNINKLVNLRNLDINSCTGLKCMPHGLGQLTSLRILSKFVLCLDIDYGHKGGELDELETLNNLRGHLTIENLKHGEDAIQQSKAAKLKEKQYLQSLELSWCGIVDVHSIEAGHHELQVEGLQPHPNLKSLSLSSYNGIKFPSWVMSLTNLVRFVLVSCSKCQHLPPLHQLPSLKQLRLERLHSLEFISNNSAGGDMSCSSSTPAPLFFPSLEVLMLNDLPNLKGWWKDGDPFDILPTFPYSLSMIAIWKCPKLTCMPLFPYVSKSINLQNSSWKPFQQTILSGAGPLPTSATNIIEPSSSAAAISLSSFSSLSQLTTLISSWIPFQLTIFSGATTLPTSATHTEASWPSTSSLSFTPLSQLTSLIIINIEDLKFLPDYLKSLTSLKTLHISHCEELKSLSPGIQNLTSLQDLEIESCEKLNMSDGAEANTMWEPLQSLLFLKLKGLPKLVDLPEGLQHLTSLQLLEIDRCSNLVSLRGWIKRLKSLRGLQISQCPKMASLPEEIKSLSSLQTLWILGCSTLGPRCLRDTGEDWPKIAQIPQLKVADCIY